MESINEIQSYKDLVQQSEREKFMMRNAIDQSSHESSRLNDENVRIR